MVRNFVTIVSGLPRSGTSMLMQMLAAGGFEALTDQIRSADDDNPKGYYELEAVKKTKDDASWLAGAEGKAVKMIYRLLYDLPADRSYRVVFMRRKMDEVLASQSVMLERRGEKGAGLPPEKMAELFESELAKFDAWIAQQECFEILDIDYAQAVSDPAAQAKRIDEFLGGGLDVDAMAATVDPSLYRNRA